MEFLDNKIVVKRELSDLDIFTIDFIRLLRKHSKYVIVSGYVSILLGRSRSSEDVDIIIPKMESIIFQKFLSELSAAGFYCLNAETTIYDYLNNGFAVRFARVNNVIPNIELKFAKNQFDEISLSKNIVVALNQDELVISNLELQIVFKEKVLCSEKDIEDARHIRNIAKAHLNSDMIKKYEVMLHGL